MTILQSLVLPNLDVQATEELYVRLNERAWAALEAPRLHFEDGGVLWTDTFYGGLAAGHWRRHCDIDALQLVLEGRGRFVLSIGLHRLEQATVWLGECTVSLDGTPHTIDVPGWPAVRDGMVFFRLRALGAGSLDEARYLTPGPAVRDVRLGLVITHFNRQAQVMPAVDRIQRALQAREDLRAQVTLTVVDNSRNLSLPQRAGVQLIPNRNLGGTGGFVRGLLELMDGGRHSHALFMDDDASCEPESIARTLALLGQARNPRLAVAGALLDEAQPWHLLERGARFDGLCKPLGAGLDLRRVDHLLLAEREPERPDYGGWWFFAFPIAGLQRFPYPFFVRGDDVFFSLTNDFELVTASGVACLGEDFRLKHGPMTAYLDARYHLLHALLRPRGGLRALLRVVRRQFFKPLMAYHYASARAFTLALQHLAQGPAFFRDNLDLAQVRTEIAAWTPAEMLQPLQTAGLRLRGARNRPESPWRRLGRVLTLQAFLLPRAMLLNRVVVQDKGFHGNAGTVFRFRHALYQHRPTDTGYIVSHDRSLFFGELRRFLCAVAHLLSHWSALRRAHADGLDELATATFWRQVYGRPVQQPAANEPISPTAEPRPGPAAWRSPAAACAAPVRRS